MVSYTLESLIKQQCFSVALYNVKGNIPILIRVLRNQYLINDNGTYTKLQQSSQSGCNINPLNSKLMSEEAQETTPEFNIAQSIIGSYDTNNNVRLNNTQFKLCMESLIDTDLTTNENDETILIIVFEDGSQLQHILL